MKYESEFESQILESGKKEMYNEGTLHDKVNLLKKHHIISMFHIISIFHIYVLSI